MVRRFRWGWALLAVGVAACSEAPVILVFNNADAPITLKLDPLSMFGRRFRTLQAGASAKVIAGTMLPPGALISVGGCDVGYVWKVDRRIYIAGQRIYNPPIKFQIDPDLTVHLLPADAKGIMPSASIAAFEEAYGFPVKPLFKQCRR